MWHARTIHMAQLSNNERDEYEATVNKYNTLLQAKRSHKAYK